jgi:hypothetical protein
MPRSRTDVQPELTSFVRAMRRHAGRMRRRAPHDKAAERLRAFADYLDAQADTLQAVPVGSPVAQVQPARRNNGSADSACSSRSLTPSATPP